jgi:hypothetical protein
MGLPEVLPRGLDGPGLRREELAATLANGLEAQGVSETI